jgi:hypothetical protein
MRRVLAGHAAKGHKVTQVGGVLLPTCIEGDLIAVILKDIHEARRGMQRGHTICQVILVGSGPLPVEHDQHIAVWRERRQSIWNKIAVSVPIRDPVPTDIHHASRGSHKS